jgi:DNA-binding LacI/PurR family transcriptional regulator
VIGYDDSRLARLSHVDLTTVAQDTEQMTTLAVTRAIDRLNGTPVAHRELVIPPHLVVRGTTAAPRGRFTTQAGLRDDPAPWRPRRRP